MILKRIAISVLSLILALTLLSGCAPAKTAPEDDVPAVLCAAFAEYDWARRILGSNPSGIALQLLNSSGMDMHSYQPSVADMVKIADADLVIFTGGDSEFWIDDALASSADTSCSPKSLKMMDIFNHDHEMADRYTSDEHHHSHEHGHGHGHDEHTEEHLHSTDEHLFLSLKMAPAFIREITDALCTLDSSNSDYYNSNAEEYIAEIMELDRQYEEAAAEASHRTLLFADRYPFKYLLEDYGLEHVTAFPGCSAETEASFETILTLSESVEQLNLNAVFILHKSKPDLARTVISNTSVPDIQILTLNSMQSVTKSDIQEGMTWLSVMEQNLQVLKKALN